MLDQKLRKPNQSEPNTLPSYRIIALFKDAEKRKLRKQTLQQKLLKKFGTLFNTRQTY